MLLQSESTLISASAKAVFSFLSDFHHFEHLLPEQVKHWEAATDRCAFTIEGLPQISLKMGASSPYEGVEYLPDGDSPVHFSLRFQLEQIEEEKTRCIVKLDADLNPMLSMMAKRPLQNFVDLIARKLQEYLDAKQTDQGAS